MAKKWYDEIDWFRNLIKDNKARKKAGNYKGHVSPGTVLVDGTVAKARDIGREEITKKPQLASFVPRTITYTTPMTLTESDTANELHKPKGFNYIKGLPNTVLYSDTIPENKWDREIMPSHMIMLPEDEDDPTAPRRFIDGSRDPRAYAQYVFQDYGGKFSDEQLGAAMEFREHPERTYTRRERDLIKSVDPTSQVKVELDQMAKPDPFFGALTNPIKKIGKLESPLKPAVKSNTSAMDVVERLLFPGIAKNDEYDFMKTVGGLRNIIDNSQGHFGNLRKYIASAVGGGKEPEMTVITDGEDPVDKDGNRFNLKTDAGIYYRMPNNKVYSEKDIANYQVDTKKYEVVLPDGSRFEPEEFNKAIDIKNAFYGLPDGTKLEQGKYGVTQDRRGWFSMATKDPRTPLQDAQGRFPNEKGYNLKDNFMDAGWTEILPFMTDTFLQSFPRMINKYAAAGLALNDMEKSVRGIDNSTMEPAKTWKLWEPPTYEAKTETLGEMTKNTIMDPVQAGTEYMLGGIGGIGSAAKKLGLKALGKTASKEATENTIQGVGGDFLSNAIEEGLIRLLGPTGRPIGRTLAAMITEGPIEEGTNSIIGSKLSKTMTPSSYGVRDKSAPTPTAEERETKERNDFITSSVAGGLMGGALSSIYKDPTIKATKKNKKKKANQIKFVDAETEERY